MKNILIFNVGSSSIKYGIYKGVKKRFCGCVDKLCSKEDYEKAFCKVYHELKNEKMDLIIHRVVHGGSINRPSRITKEVKKEIKEFSEFAPLHNPLQLMIIELSEKFKKSQYAVFDTSFFYDLPKVSVTYAIPLEISKKYNIKRYGFHGISHSSVSKGLGGRTIICHLGQGVSISALRNGKPLDTSMGLTPLEGLVMCTRSGSIDPGLIIFLQKKGYDMQKILNYESGLKGLCGLSDFRDVLKNMKNKKVKLAYDVFVYNIIKYIGAYVAVLNGLDNLVFTGAIGENSSWVRKDVCISLNYLGLKLDKLKNEKNNEIISLEKSKVKVYVKKADEEIEMIKEVMKILK